MRYPRTVLVAAAAFGAAVMTAATVQAAPATTPAPAPARAPAPAAAPAAAARPAIVPATNVPDAEVAKYAKAIVKVSAISRGLAGAAPTEAQRAEMAAAVTSNGLTIERFQAIGMATNTDKVLKARVIVAGTPASAAGSVGAGVTDAETNQFAKALVAIRKMNPTETPTPEQEAAQKAAITSNGMTVARFEAIVDASMTDNHLKARISLAVAKLG